MKIHCAGCEGYINQIQRIREGFLELGCELTNPESADLIYCNDPTVYSPEFKKNNKKAKIIYNVLDVPPSLMDSTKYDLSKYPPVIVPWEKNFDPLQFRIKLLDADIITCICEEVKWQLKNWCELDSFVIFNPIKDVSWLNLKDEQKIKNKEGKRYKYLYVGRANDPSKRFNLVSKTIQELGDSYSDLAILGPENPKWGHYYGVVEDKMLNLFYNSVDYFFFPSAFKSLGLPALESVVAKTIPIVTNDDPTTKDFWEPIGVDPNKISSYLLDENWNKLAQNFVEEKSEEYSIKFNKKSIAKNIINIYNQYNE
jgi:glycosyltransferase involved in cell wall biosynthesis